MFTKRNHRLANDAGLTPIEVIVAITLIAILSGAVVWQVFSAVSKADDNEATLNLQSTVNALKRLRNITLTDGNRNYAATPASTTNTTTHPNTEDAIANLRRELPNLNFLPYGTNGSDNFGELKDAEGDPKVIWVDLPKNETTLSKDLATSDGKYVEALNPQKLETDKTYIFVKQEGTAISAGDLIRVGLKSPSGATFCAVLAANGSAGSKSGTTTTADQSTSTDPEKKIKRFEGVGWQSVDVINTNNNKGATCGAAAADGTNKENQFAEMPGTPGVDATLQKPGSGYYGIIR